MRLIQLEISYSLGHKIVHKPHTDLRFINLIQEYKNQLMIIALLFAVVAVLALPTEFRL